MGNADVLESRWRLWNGEGRRGLVEAIWLAALSAALAAIFYFGGYSGIALEDSGVYLSAEEAASLPTVLWIDARTQEEFDEERVKGALLLNEDDWEALFFPVLEAWNPDQAIAVYCSRSACLRSLDVAKRLREELGVEEVFAVSGGWEALMELGIPLEGER